MSQKNQKKTVLIIGCSFGGLTAAQCLDSKFNVILVDKKSYFEYTPAFPLTLTDPNYIDKVTADIPTFAKNNKFQFIRGTLVQLLPNSAVIKQSETGQQRIDFDYCILSTGSSYASSVKAENDIQTVAQRKESIGALIAKLSSSRKVLVVGGGFVGIEISGVLKDHYKNLQVDLWTRSSQLLVQHPEKARTMAHDFHTKAGINIVYNRETTELPELQYDHIFDCRGNIYAPSYMTGLFQQYVDEKGRIIVDEYYRLQNNSNIYCIGDACITANDESKMGYNASIQGQYAAENINTADKNGKSFKKLEGTANLFNIVVDKKRTIQCFGEKVSESKVADKQSHGNTFIKAIQGSCYSSFVSSFQRKMIVMITGCMKKKKPSPKTEQQSENKISPNKQLVVNA